MGETSTSTSTSSKLELSAPKLVAIVALLIVFKEGVDFFWLYATLGPVYLGIGILEIVMAAVILLAIIAQIVDLKVEILKKLYHWVVLLIIGIIVIIIELWGNNFSILSALYTGTLLGGILVIIAALIELLADKNTSKLMLLIAAIWAIVEAVVLFIAVAQNTPGLVGIKSYNATQAVYYGVIAIICAVLLLLVLQEKVNVKLKLDWWLVLIIGFILYTWVAPGVAGILVFVAFICMVMA